MHRTLRYAARVLARDPGPTAIAILSLAIAIGASTAIFSLADALFLRPLAVRDPDRLVSVMTRAETGRLQPLSFPEYQDVRTLEAFEDVAVFDRRGATYRDGDDLEMLLLAAVSDNYFGLLGVRPALGRVFAPGLDRRQLPAPAVLISHRVWQRRFGADPAIAGKTIHLSDRLYFVLGVLPAEFRGLDRGPVTDVWIDLDTWTRFYGSPQALLARAHRAFETIARLKPGATPVTAGAQLSALATRWARDYPDAYRRRGLLAATADEVSGASGWRMTSLLVSIVAVVVVIACVNVATLRMAQGDRRRRELGVRVALGAAPTRITRQLLGESLLIVALATAGGLLVGRWLIQLAPALLPPSPIAVDYGVALDGRVLGVALVLASLAALVSGAMPALRASRTDVVTALKTPVDAPHRSRLVSLRTVLVTLQVALAVVLLDGAGLLLQGFLATRHTWPGFAADKELVVLQLASPDKPLAQWPGALDAMRERVAALPGVTHVTYVRRIPMAEYGGGATLPVSVLRLVGEGGAGADTRGLRYNQVGPSYLETLGTRLVRGRFFVEADHAATARVVVVNETMARQYFRGTDPLGQTLTIARDPYTVIGVVEDARISRLHEQAEPFFYLPFAAQPSSDVALVAETGVAAGSLAPAVKRAARAASPGAHILATMTMQDHMAAQLYDEWMPAMLGSGLSMIGVGLSLVGLYGAVSLLTVRRTRELGIRLALGAAPRRILALVLAQGLLIAAAGAVCGALLARPVAILLAGVLPSRGSHDGLVLVASVAAALLIGTLAALVPAARALRIDPARTLRYE